MFRLVYFGCLCLGLVILVFELGGGVCMNKAGFLPI